VKTTGVSQPQDKTDFKLKHSLTHVNTIVNSFRKLTGSESAVF